MSDVRGGQPINLRVIGLDLSLTATGVCDDQPAAYKTRQTGMPRLILIRDHILNLVLDRALPVLVVVEGFSYASPNQAHQLGGLGYIIRLALYEAGVPYADIPPSSLKKFATGKGNANKAAMGLAAARNGYDGPGDDNAIDAWWLQRLGYYAHQGPAEALNATVAREDVVHAIDWPTYDQGAA